MPTFPGKKVAAFTVVPVQGETTHEIVHFSNDWTVFEEVGHCTCDICDWTYDVRVQS